MFTLPARSVLVPVDLSGPSLEAARVGRSLGGKLHVVHVLDALEPTEPGVVWGQVDDAERRRATTQAVAEALADAGVDVAGIYVEIGDAAERIAEVAGRLGVDLVVLPSHHRTGLARLALGSVAEHVVRLAPCAVLVLREE